MILYSQQSPILLAIRQTLLAVSLLRPIWLSLIIRLTVEFQLISFRPYKNISVLSAQSLRLSFAIYLSVLVFFGALLRRRYSRDISAQSAIAMYA